MNPNELRVAGSKTGLTSKINVHVSKIVLTLLTMLTPLLSPLVPPLPLHPLTPL
jgi:hypothetical protein